MESASYAVRYIRADELEQLIPLCIEHAAFERAKPIETRALAERLRMALSGGRWRAWIAHIDRELVGYASVAPEFSTWSGDVYWHLDCLYVRAHARGLGIGRGLMHAVGKEASERGIRELQWQTPDWNADAQRFYLRLGASMQMKARFTLELKQAEITKSAHSDP